MEAWFRFVRVAWACPAIVQSRLSDVNKLRAELMGTTKLLDGPLKRLLVNSADDDLSFLRELLNIGSDQAAVQLSHARSIAEALSHLATAECNLILCDYKPGDGAALTLLRQLRQQKHNVPVVFLSDHMCDSAVETIIHAMPGPLPPPDVPREIVAPRLIRNAIKLYCHERQHRKAEDMLRKLFRAVEQADDLVVIADQSGVVEYVNPAYEALTGYSREEAIGQNMLSLCNGDGVECCREMWKTILSGEMYRGVVENGRKNGQRFLSEKTVTPLRDYTGKITNFISTDRDISERRRLEAQLQQAQKMDAIGRLAGGVAHDFNNLLMVVSSYAELMLDSLATEHPLRRNVGEIIA